MRLDIHVFTGLLASVLVSFHSAFQLRTPIAMSAASLGVVVLTGLIGRFLYALTPAADRRRLRDAMDAMEAALPGRRDELATALDALPGPAVPPNASMLRSLLAIPRLARGRQGAPRIAGAAAPRARRAAARAAQGRQGALSRRCRGGAVVGHGGAPALVAWPAPPVRARDARRGAPARWHRLVLRVSLDFGVRSAALALLLCACVLVLVPRRARAQVLSPGPLSAAHANIDTDDDCGKCHQSGSKIVASLCLDCHKEFLGAKIAAGSGLHGRQYRGQPCENCHVEHVGKNAKLVRWPGGDPSKLDHELTGWTLAGGHKAVTCAKCHTKVSPLGKAQYVGVKTTCAGCHKDPHAGRFTAECKKCHNESAARPGAPGAFGYSGVLGTGVGSPGPPDVTVPSFRTALTDRLGPGALPHLPEHHLDGPAHRDGHQRPGQRTQRRTEDPAEVGADQDRQEDPQRVHPDRPAHHHRVEEVVLDQLEADEHDQGDDTGRRRVQRGQDHRRHAGDQPPDQGDHGHQRHPQAEQEGERDARGSAG